MRRGFASGPGPADALPDARNTITAHFCEFSAGENAVVFGHLKHGTGWSLVGRGTLSTRN